jgi:hypothetical protein
MDRAGSSRPDAVAELYPILSLHWGLPQNDEPPPHILDLRLQRDVEKVHQLGPRAFYALLDEISCRHSCRTFIEARAQRYASLDPEIVKQLGGDKFSPPPLHEAP